MALWTAIFDFTAAIVAALVIIPACFAYGLTLVPDQGYYLLPCLHTSKHALGRIFMILFTAVVFCWGIIPTKHV